MGVNGLSIGVESGDNYTLKLANKGYNSRDILEQCRRLDEANIDNFSEEDMIKYRSSLKALG